MLEVTEPCHEFFRTENFVLLTLLDTIIGSLLSQLPSEKKKISFCYLQGDYVCLIHRNIPGVRVHCSTSL